MEENELTHEIRLKSCDIDEQLKGISYLHREIQSMKENVNSLLKELSREDDTTLEFHGVNSRIRTLINQQRYTPIYKDLPLEKRLDAMEKDLCKMKEDISRLNNWIAVYCPNEELRRKG